MPSPDGRSPADLDNAPILAERQKLLRLTTALEQLRSPICAAIKARERLVDAPPDIVEEKCQAARTGVDGLLIERVARDELPLWLDTAYGIERMPSGPYWADNLGIPSREAKRVVSEGVASNIRTGGSGTVLVDPDDFASFSEDCIAAINGGIIVGVVAKLPDELAAALQSGDELSGYRDLRQEERPEVRDARQAVLEAVADSTKSAEAAAPAPPPVSQDGEPSLANGARGPTPLLAAEAAGELSTRPMPGDGVANQPALAEARTLEGIAETAKAAGRPPGTHDRRSELSSDEMAEAKGRQLEVLGEAGEKIYENQKIEAEGIKRQRAQYYNSLKAFMTRNNLLSGTSASADEVACRFIEYVRLKLPDIAAMLPKHHTEENVANQVTRIWAGKRRKRSDGAF